MDNRRIVVSASTEQRGIVRALAFVMAVLWGSMVAIGLLVADDPGGILGFGLLLTPGVAFAFLPLAFSGTSFRITAGVVGVGLILGGFALIIAVVGLLMIPIGTLYLAVAISPGNWSKRRTGTLGFVLGAIGFYGTLVLLYLLGDLIGVF